MGVTGRSESGNLVNMSTNRWRMIEVERQGKCKIDRRALYYPNVSVRARGEPLVGSQLQQQGHSIKQQGCSIFVPGKGLRLLPVAY